MSLQVILDAIYASGEDQTHAIEALARAQVGKILTEAHAQARRIHEESYAKASAPAAEARARILHQAQIEAMHIVSDAREALIDEALRQTRVSLAGLRADAAYPGVLRRLLEEALAAFDDSPEEAAKVQLESDPRDRALLKRILRDMGLNLPMNYELHCWGGLGLKSEDGRIVVINTLEARLERATPYLRHHLATLLEDRQ